MAFEWIKKPFAKAVEFFLGKLINVPTQRWTDLEAEEHDWAFAVAGATKAELLSDLRGLVEQSITDGLSFGDFKKQFADIVARQGWEHRGDLDWRARTIYQTNLRTAYAAGRYQQQEDVKDTFPYRQWIHGDTRQPRPNHLALDGKVFAADDPFWRNHYPPIFAGALAWGCHCRTRLLSRGQVERRGLQVEQPPQPGQILEVTFPDGRKGVVQQAEIAGNALAPGLSRREGRQQVLQGILDRLPPELRGQLESEIRNKNTPETLMRELQRLGVSHTPENIVRIGRQPNGQIVFLESGQAGDGGNGLAHIVERHLSDFLNQGIPEADIPDFVVQALTHGTKVLKQGRRDIYELNFQGQTRYVAVTISDNGFVVGANPVGKRNLARLQRQQERRDAQT
jgi:hypothetical protein